MKRTNLLVYALSAVVVAAVVSQSWAGREVTADSLLNLLVIALPLAGIYAMSASGLVVVYTTTGLFNFAQGAIGMFLAFAYWELRVNRDLPTWLALPLVVLVVAPALGVALDRGVMRHLQNQALVVQLMVTLGLMLGFMGVAATVWTQDTGRSMPTLFGNGGFEIGDVTVTWHRFTTLVVALALALWLRYLLFRTRIGVAMRAVVDNRSLAALNGARPDVVSGTAWALGCSMAALAGILIAPETNMGVETLTLVILNAFAAAIVGRLRSLPLTYLGALLLGLAIQFSRVFLSLGQRWGQAPLALPALLLFVTLLVLPVARLRFARITTVRRTEPVSTVRDTAIGMVVLFAAMVVLTEFLGIENLNRVMLGMTTALIALSLVPLTGWAGQVNLAPLAFAGFGAVAYAKWGGEHGAWYAIVLAAAITVPVGAVMALPALRLQGLYLALASMAFASMAQFIIFTQPEMLGSQSAFVERLDIFGFSFDDERSYLLLCTAVFGMLGVLVVALRRSPFGRRLVALRDSEAASATVGVNILATKVGVFMLSCGMAGFAGAFFAQAKESIAASDFTMLAGLPIVLSLVIGGVATVAGALFAGAFSILLLIIVKEFPDISFLRALEILGPGLAALGIIRNPSGAVVAIGDAFAPLLPWRRDAKRRRAAEIEREAEPEVGELGLTRPYTEQDVLHLERTLGVAGELAPERRREDLVAHA